MDSILIALLVFLVAASFAFMVGATFGAATAIGVAFGAAAGVADRNNIFG